MIFVFLDIENEHCYFSKMVVTMSAVSCAIVGDGMVGKTCLAKQFSGLEVTENYVATIMDIFSGTASACTTDSRHSYNHF
jgi:GTPase SAR1 family protein